MGGQDEHEFGVPSSSKCQALEELADHNVILVKMNAMILRWN